VERTKLTAEELTEKLSEANNWREINGKIHRKFEFKNFAESLDFVNKVGAIAEARDHHPDITFGWGYAEFEITTHSEGGLTALDFALAKEIDGIKGQ
jgi:4a-hydroxytetrahydrobiopterin dehydratase